MKISGLIDAGNTFTVATNARLQKVTLITANNAIIHVTALIDGGASRNIIDTRVSSAGGYRLPTLGAWRGVVDAGGARRMAHWEIVDLKGAVEMILGRSWLRDVGAVHDYASDEIVVRVDGQTFRLQPAQEDRRVMAEVEPTVGAIDLQSDDDVLTLDSGEQASRVLPHPSEDLCMSADLGEPIVETCTGGADEGHRVTNPSRAGPRSTAAIPSSTAPPSLCASHIVQTPLLNGADEPFVEHENTGTREDLQPADAPTAFEPSDSSPIFGHNRCRTSTRWAFLAVEATDDDEVPDVGDWRPSGEPALKGRAAQEALRLGEMYAARYQKTRTERRKVTQARRLKNAHIAAQLLDDALRDVREGAELNSIAAAWESTVLKDVPPTPVHPADAARIAFDRVMQSIRKELLWQ
ncbi:hypothetical protein C8R46DRAFT_1213712 [Mycena filopes]|nr:hypothetical protein C8R46DRAFT_1213704 [Mycena filopes]KAJ7177157.1 hypothetical protein C8R46DRAFT_1213712 [Mycena filopes]